LPAKPSSLAGAYLKNRYDDAVKLEVALGSGDFAMVEFLGHGMRGSGGMFGFQP
jgi:hypothetical protein